MTQQQMPDPLPRCGWCGADPAYTAYHDEEWGVPSRDDRHLFEMLILEGAQAGLSWSTILRKREAYRLAYDGFDPRAVAAYGPERLEAQMQDPGIVRNRLKVAAAVANARAFLEVQREFGSFATYLWAFVGDRPRVERRRTLADVPSVSPEAQALSRDLLRRGFKFVGPTIIYAFMQAVGMVDDHVDTCWRRIMAP
ncbi:DNA-3-methyladenine glycosylase I [Mesoterricola silvestris]|uniref:DNA-3-methyladenine glycosylase n=1 Tax=Mesoterricola silvestris TaxID=2927979 RepID=A0AA48K941_9BACT|nr:DNA-3-methyladenine glycosylase I [Mesoterricola silvestris]BDU72740.1 DNA-3-methyladenine glycosylase [Mesoterricola silvestris]